jgi:uncharacterized protein YndB with AHSA1/START domain
MATTARACEPLADGTLVITRVLDAPRTLVFRAWTNPEHMARWWGPRGFTTISSEMDVRIGGKWRRRIRRPDGVDYTAVGVYRDIVAPERLVFTYAWEDNPEHPRHETVVTVTFIERGEKTELILRQEVFETAEACESHRGGWSSCLERFAEYLAAGHIS